MIKKTSMILGMLAFLMSFGAHSEELRPGLWRFELRMTHGTVPFLIEFKKSKNKYSGVIKNGKESIQLPDVQIVDKRIIIPLQTYPASLEMDQPTEGRMIGFHIRHNKNPVVQTPALAVFNEKERFPIQKSAPTIDLNGKWAVKLTDEQDKIDSGVIIFEQKGEKLNGSILTPTGDYRYMEGYVSGADFEAASFDGVYNYIVKGRLKPDGTLEAQILSSHKVKIEGLKDPKAVLPDAYKQTQLESLSFAFPNLKGQQVSLLTHEFKNKPVIIQFFGSWCPNCLDEMNYLIPWYKDNKHRGVEIIALAFERQLTRRDAKKQLLKFQNKKKIPYTLLIAGSTSEEKPMDKIPGLKNFISFPTTVFLNRKHQVIKVHAGFSGPSTGEFYEQWKVEFNQNVNAILK